MTLTFPHSHPDGRRCSRCGTWYPQHLVDRAFQMQRGRCDASNLRKHVCRPCELTARDQRKMRNRWSVKARDVIRRHALRLEVPKDELIRRYGWDPDRLAHDAKFQYGNGCNYCGEQYATMGHGLADITLDVQDKQRPYYRTNTRWCCQTCNRKKGTLSPEEFEADRQIYEERARQMALTAEARGMLF